MKPTNQHSMTPKEIAGLLTRASEQLDDNTVAALRRARHIALARQARSRPDLVLNTGHSIHWPILHAPHHWMAMAVLLIAMLAGGISYWHHVRERELSHLDLAILTDDLPMEIFLDR